MGRYPEAALVSNVIHTQMSALIIFRQRNVNYVISLLVEPSAMVDRKTLKAMYDRATEEKYNFLTIDLLAKDVDHMSYCNLDHRYEPSKMEEQKSSKSSL